MEVFQKNLLRERHEGEKLPWVCLSLIHTYSLLGHAAVAEANGQLGLVDSRKLSKEDENARNCVLQKHELPTQPRGWLDRKRPCDTQSYMNLRRACHFY